MKQSLYDKLKEYSQSDYYPFHMPGHKRNEKIDFIPCTMDITEIDGFDNLHSAQGVIRLAQQQAADLYGSEETHFLVNGSTCGILTAISALCTKNGKIIMARNCHKAAYHAAFLKELDIVYLYPDLEIEYGIQGGINPEQVVEAFKKNPDAEAVFITSPTYDGMVSDVAAIAKIAHSYGVPLIVDEAHGAHFGLCEGVVPEGSIACGADIVIHSMHKTLPSLTQTALLHINGSLVDRKKVHKYLQIYQTSSPSYVFMAGMQKCIEYIKENKSQLFTDYVNHMQKFFNQVSQLKHLRIFQYHNEMKQSSIIDADISKVVIFTDYTNITGKQLSDILRNQYHLELEMASVHYALAMTSVMDTEEGLNRLGKAMVEIDNQIGKVMTDSKMDDSNLIASRCKLSGNHLLQEKITAQTIMKISDAEEAEHVSILLDKSVNKISAEYVYLYPPGIPILAPGEMITAQVLNMLEEYKKCGLNIEGMEDDSLNTIQIVDN